jgi:hypothetical protein
MTKILSNKSSVDLDYPICRPSLDLDFTQEVLDPRITFSRGTVGTRVNRNRLIETVSANQPRFDYDPISGECRGLLIEESRSNYFWGTQTGAGGSVSDGTATGADGVTAKKFVPTSGNNVFPSISNYTAYTFTAVSGGTVDVSFSGYFAATGTGLYIPDIVIEFNTGGTTNKIYAELSPDLTNGTVWVKSGIGANGVTELIASQITLMPFGMYKVTWSIRYTQGATIRDRVHFYIQCRRKGSTVGSNTGTYYADGVNGFQYSCIQYEIGAFPTSYIPTTASTVTRSADNASMTGTNFSSWYNQSEGSLFVVASPSTNGAYSGFIYLLGTDFNNGITYLRQSDYQPVFRIRSGQRDEYSKAINGAVGFGQIWRNAVALKSAISFKTNDFNSFVSGVPITGSRATAGTLPTFTGPLYLGGLNGSTYLNGTISRLTYYPKALKPNQLQYLTA